MTPSRETSRRAPQRDNPLRFTRPSQADAPSTWIGVPEGSDFPLSNLPYGVFAANSRDRNGRPRVGVAIGECVLDVAALAASGVHVPYSNDFAMPSLNQFMSRGRPAWSAVRERLSELLSAPVYRDAVSPYLVPQSEVTLHLPVEIGDYVDFYSSRHHAENVGRLFRPDSEPLTPNWRHLPIGYHGRAGTVVVSGTPIVRPSGQRRVARNAQPSFGPSTRLDIEAEVGFVIGVPSKLGESVPVASFREHVFGAVLVNDWSARDIQSWEYVPLGPFLGKSFATSVSPWVVPLDALEHARVTAPAQEPPVLPYLADDRSWGLELLLEVEWNDTVVSRPPFAEMYWTPAQQLAHMTVNGASVRTGDLYASGTVSGPARDQCGSFLELSWNGAEPVILADGSRRSFLEDGDTVTIRATAPGPADSRLGFGSLSGTVRPSATT
jgi:fumarylacetoacetase